MARSHSKIGNHTSTDVAASLQLGGARAWFIWSLSALAFGYAFVQRVAPSVMVSDLMADFAIGGGMLGVLSALYFYPYVVLQVPLGALLDRVGPRLLLVTALLLAGLGSFMFGSSTSLPVAYAGRALVGAGSAVGFLASLMLASKWFPPRRYAMLAGMTMLFGMTSGILGQGPMALFVENYGWRASQYALGGFAVALAFLVAVFVRNAPEEAAPVVKARESWASIFTSIGEAARLWAVWKVAFIASAMSGPMLVLGGLWGTPYLMEAFDLTRPQAAFYVSFILLGWAIGAPTSGWLSDVLNRKRSIVIAGCLVMTCAIGAIVFVPVLPLYAVVALFLITGVSGSAMVVTFAIVRGQVPERLAGSSTGIVNGMTVASGAVFQPLVGFALDHLWAGRLVDGSRLYEPQTYQTAFLLVLAISIGGTVLALLLPQD